MAVGVQAQMTGRRLRLVPGLVLGLGLALAGCQDGKLSLAGLGGGGGADQDDDGAAAATAAMAGQTTELVERDVEAPDVFQVTGAGLWDGRPSLGGVWVAHPDVTDPERVIIRNTDNGEFVIGALFRRERDNPGPALQVSSDAAEALGMLAGAPANLNVTALRREEPPPPTAVPAPDADAGAVATVALAPAADIAATPLDPVAGAAAAIDAADATGAPAIAAPAATALPPVTPVPATSDLGRPFIQIGIFSVEANARGAAQDLDAKGLPARVVPGETQGSAFWRVIVGPARTEAERATFLDRVKAEGFADAYFVRS